MKKRVLGILLALVMVLALLPAPASAANVVASGYCGSNATWVITDDGVMTISGTGEVTRNVNMQTIREEYKDLVHTLIIEEGITSLGYQALCDVNMAKTVILPDSLHTIGYEAFFFSKMEKIVLGNGLTTIREQAFSNTSRLKEVVLPDSLQTIEKSAFSFSGIESVVIPGSVKTISDSAFGGCHNLKTVVIKNGVQSIGNTVFSQCESLEDIILPDSITSIGSFAFSQCSSLIGIRLPAQLKIIDGHTFADCTSLEYLIMSGSITDIYMSAFENTPNLKEIYYAGTEAQLSGIRVGQEGNEQLESVDIYLIPAMPDPVFYLYDMPAPDNWAYPGIAFCLYNGLMKGTGGGYFQPNSYTTRAQLVAILWRLMGEPKPESPAPFTDLTQDWYRDAVAWAAENNITKGTSATTFAPDEYVTREQMVTIFYRMCRDYLGFDMSPSASLDKFPDNGKVSGWAVDAMKWGIAVKLINGAADGSGNVYLMPQGNAIRSQVATVMLNFVTAFEEYFVDEDTTDAAPQTPAALPAEGLVSRKGI